MAEPIDPMRRVILNTIRRGGHVREAVQTQVSVYHSIRAPHLGLVWQAYNERGRLAQGRGEDLVAGLCYALSIRLIPFRKERIVMADEARRFLRQAGAL